MSQRGGQPSGGHERISAFSQIIGRTRFVVVIAVVAVMLVAFSLFLQGTIQAAQSIYSTWADVWRGEAASQQTAIEFLEIVSTMLKAVVFYLIGVGFYSLFIAPLNLTSALGVESFADLEHKVVSVVVVILGITFLEHFVRWEKPLDTLYFGAAMALAVAALVFFQRVSGDHQGADQVQPETRIRARRELFENENEQRTIGEQEVRRAEQATESNAETPAGEVNGG